MSPRIHRRSFLGTSLSAFVVGPFPRLNAGSTPAPPGALDQFPLQDPALVRAIVAASHGNVDRVRELLKLHPALAEASIDWGFGDWETALGAAAHTGQREIAELLVSHGATPTIFSAAMLGHLGLVEAFVRTSPGIQRRLGPHSITLLAHARAGGENAAEVRAYLDRLGDADTLPTAVALTDDERSGYLGIYAFGDQPTDRVEVLIERNAVVIRRPGGTARPLRCVGPGEFVPAGAEAVRVRFAPAVGRATSLTVSDPAVVVTATRVE